MNKRWMDTFLIIILLVLLILIFFKPARQEKELKNLNQANRVYLVNN